MADLVLPDLLYECVGCGKSCTAFQVEVAPADLARLQQLPTTRELGKPLRVLDSGRAFLGKDEDGRCSYLTPATRCSIHADKPLTCQDFPFSAVDTPGGVFLGASFLCTAVAQGLGPPLEARREELAGRFGRSESSQDDRWRLWDDLAVDWPTYLQIEGLMASSLAADPERGLLTAATRVARSVGPARGVSEAAPVGEDLVLGLLTLIETAGEHPDAIAVVHQALHRGQAYPSRALGARVEPARLAPDLPEWFVEQAFRYLSHLLFRKTLLEPPDVLSRVCLMPLVSDALRFYTRASAQSHGRGVVLDDFYTAAGILDGRLLLHAGGMESYFQHVARGFLGRSPQPEQDGA